MSRSLFVLGIDPGTRIVGYGIVKSSGNRLGHVDSGVIETQPSEALPLRLKKIYDDLCDVLSKNTPDCVSIEDIFYSKNAKSALKLGHARGVAILACMNQGIDVFEYTPTQIKSAVVGFGRAEKCQIQQMVKILLKLNRLPKTDEADALAASICHINTAGSGKNRLLRNA